MLTAASALIWLSMSAPLPIRECSTDGDCQHALAEIGCREVDTIRRPRVYSMASGGNVIVCDRATYEAALQRAGR